MSMLMLTVMKEGAAIVAFKLVTLGMFDEEGVTQLLKAPGERGDPACSGTRNLQDNLSDLRAQVRPKVHVLSHFVVVAGATAIVATWLQNSNYIGTSMPVDHVPV